jgi:excisionase family DNA binding protein
MNNQLTTLQAAQLRGVTREAIQKWIKRYGLKAEKFGRDWLINQSDLDKFTPRKAGRPAKEQPSND